MSNGRELPRVSWRERLLDYFFIAGVDDSTVKAALAKESVARKAKAASKIGAAVAARRAPAAAAAVEVAPVVLDRFPTDDHEDFAFPKYAAGYCFPKPVRVRSHKPRSPEYATFAFDGADRRRVYGHCFRFYEKVATQDCHVPKCLVFISRHAFYDVVEHMLRWLYLTFVCEKMVNPAILVAHFLNEVPLPRFNANIIYKLHSQCITRLIRRSPYYPPMLAPASKILLERFEFRQLELLVVALLCESRIVVKSKSESNSETLLTPVMEAAVSMVFPLRWHHLYISVLPRSLAKPLQSYPHPFLVGIKPNSAEIPENCVVVDMEFGIVDRSRLKTPLPELPKSFSEYFSQWYSKARVSFPSDPVARPLMEVMLNLVSGKLQGDITESPFYARVRSTLAASVFRKTMGSRLRNPDASVLENYIERMMRNRKYHANKTIHQPPQPVNAWHDTIETLVASKPVRLDTDAAAAEVPNAQARFRKAYRKDSRAGGQSAQPPPPHTNHHPYVVRCTKAAAEFCRSGRIMKPSTSGNLSELDELLGTQGSTTSSSRLRNGRSPVNSLSSTSDLSSRISPQRMKRQKTPIRSQTLGSPGTAGRTRSFDSPSSPFDDPASGSITMLGVASEGLVTASSASSTSKYISRRRGSFDSPLQLSLQPDPQSNTRSYSRGSRPRARSRGSRARLGLGMGFEPQQQQQQHRDSFEASESDSSSSAALAGGPLRRGIGVDTLFAARVNERGAGIGSTTPTHTGATGGALSRAALLSTSAVANSPRSRTAELVVTGSPQSAGAAVPPAKNPFAESDGDDNWGDLEFSSINLKGVTDANDFFLSSRQSGGDRRPSVSMSSVTAAETSENDSAIDFDADGEGESDNINDWGTDDEEFDDGDDDGAAGTTPKATSRGGASEEPSQRHLGELEVSDAYREYIMQCQRNHDEEMAGCEPSPVLPAKGDLLNNQKIFPAWFTLSTAWVDPDKWRVHPFRHYHRGHCDATVETRD